MQICKKERLQIKIPWTKFSGNQSKAFILIFKGFNNMHAVRLKMLFSVNRLIYVIKFQLFNLYFFFLQKE